MTFWQNVLRILDARMPEPQLYGWFHLLWLAISIGAAVWLCACYRDASRWTIINLVFGVAVTVIVMEVYKLINFSFEYEDGVVFDFSWYSFPWQFCSTPMYVGLLAGLIRKGKVHDALCAYLATFSIFAGVAVMIYPSTVFTETIGINIQTMFCHGSMITVGAYLLGSGHVKLEHRTVLKAVPVFAVTVGIAMVLNEIAYYSGLLKTDDFNMFYISRHCEPFLPVYSEVQKAVPYPWCLILYILGFTAAAYLMLLIAMGIRKLCVALTKKKAVA